jgi:hypothetical protein
MQLGSEGRTRWPEFRSDVLILDDVEPDEANNTPYLAEKRLGPIIDSVFPLNVRARVRLVGTATHARVVRSPGSARPGRLASRLSSNTPAA